MYHENNTKIINAIKQGYTIDKIGNCYAPNKKLVGHTAHGYRSFTCCKQHILVHRFQAYQKYGELLFVDGMVARHLNGNPLDNSWDNIVIGTQKDNMADISVAKRKERAINAGKVKFGAGAAKQAANKAVCDFRQSKKDYEL